MSFNRDIPMIGFHTRMGGKNVTAPLLRLIEEVLAPEGINTLIMEFSIANYKYECFPEYVAEDADFGKEEALIIKEACEKHGIRPVPMIQCLSHQNNSYPLLKAHPEFIETTNVPDDAGWPDVYCPSWCASNDDIYEYVFPMMDELIEVFGAEAFHVGLDEVFDIGEETCPRCAGKDKAQLFAHTVKILHDHLTEKGIDMMMWGDRLLDCKKLGYQMWEADRFGMHRAFDMPEISRDIIICDWHYDMHDHGYPSTEQFVKGGFFDVPSFGSNLEQAKHFWGFCTEDIYMSRKFQWKGKVGGVLFTHWCPMNDESVDKIIAGYHGDPKAKYEFFSNEYIGQQIAVMAKTCAQFRKVY